jgi:exonuclease VII small subunit
VNIRAQTPADQSAEGTSLLFKIARITLRSGLAFKPGQLTVAIGPNNGGKSEFLNDIVAAIARPSAQRSSVETVEVEFPMGAQKVIDSLTANAQKDESNQLILDGPDPDFSQSQHMRYPPSQLGIGGPITERDAEGAVAAYLGRKLISHLTTERRLLLVKRQVNRVSNLEGAGTPLEAAFEAPEKVMTSVYEAVSSAFGYHLHLDKSVFASLEFRLGEGTPVPAEPSECKKFFAQLSRLDEQGDGIRSFAGILVATAASLRPVVAIDEPEAFLHPPQAFLIGKALAALRGHTQLYIATHSVDVLRGILSETQDVNVIRFSKNGGRFITRQLDIQILESIAADPVLKSGRVLDGLFYNGVVVTESDGDVALYRAVLDNIDRALSVTFINSYSKHSSVQITRPFRAMGVPSAIVTDFDAFRVRHEFRQLYEGVGGNWSDIEAAYTSFLAGIEGANTAETRLNTAQALMGKVMSELPSQGDAQKQLSWLRKRVTDIRESATAWAEAKKRGRDALTSAAQAAFDKLDTQCRSLGLFIVPCGEREAWLTPAVGFSKNKRAWTDRALRHIDTSPLPQQHRLRVFVSALHSYCAGKGNAGDGGAQA